MDEADRAQPEIEAWNDEQIRAAVKPVPRLPYTGDCYNPVCANTPPAPQPFCCGACEKAFRQYN